MITKAGNKTDPLAYRLIRLLSTTEKIMKSSFIASLEKEIGDRALNAGSARVSPPLLQSREFSTEHTREGTRRKRGEGKEKGELRTYSHVKNSFNTVNWKVIMIASKKKITSPY